MHRVTTSGAGTRDIGHEYQRALRLNFTARCATA